MLTDEVDIAIIFTQILKGAKECKNLLNDKDNNLALITIH